MPGRSKNTTTLDGTCQTYVSQDIHIQKNLENKLIIQNLKSTRKNLHEQESSDITNSSKDITSLKISDIRTIR